eukprot:15366462-Ditylum_brightwellii.AAC.4
MCNNTVVIGEITNIHEKLIRHEDFITKITEKIARWLALPNNIAQQWTQEAGISDDRRNVTVPNFRITLGESKFGNSNSKAKATTLKIVITNSNRLYAKSLFSNAWARDDKPRGVFVPAGSDLITNPVTYKQLLCNHNAYIDSTTALAIEGLHPNVLD